MEIDDHRKRQARLDHRGSGHHFEDEEDSTGAGRDDNEGRARGDARAEPQRGRKQAHFHAELSDFGRQSRVPRRIGKVAQPARERAGGGGDQWHGEHGEKPHREKRELKAGVEKLLGIEQKESDCDGREQVDDAPLADRNSPQS